MLLYLTAACSRAIILQAAAKGRFTFIGVLPNQIDEIDFLPPAVGQFSHQLA